MFRFCLFVTVHSLTGSLLEFLHLSDSRISSKLQQSHWTYNMSAMATGISNVHSVCVNDSYFSTVSGTQIINNYNVRAPLNAGKLCWTPHRALDLICNRP